MLRVLAWAVTGLADSTAVSRWLSPITSTVSMRTATHSATNRITQGVVTLHRTWRAPWSLSFACTRAR